MIKKYEIIKKKFKVEETWRDWKEIIKCEKILL